MKYVVSCVETSRAFRLLVFCSADLTVIHELRSILPCGVSYSDCDRTATRQRCLFQLVNAVKRNGGEGCGNTERLHEYPKRVTTILNTDIGNRGQNEQCRPLFVLRHQNRGRCGQEKVHATKPARIHSPLYPMDHRGTQSRAPLMHAKGRNTKKTALVLSLCLVL